MKRCDFQCIQSLKMGFCEEQEKNVFWNQIKIWSITFLAFFFLWQSVAVTASSVGMQPVLVSCVSINSDTDCPNLLGKLNLLGLSFERIYNSSYSTLYTNTLSPKLQFEKIIGKLPLPVRGIDPFFGLEGGGGGESKKILKFFGKSQYKILRAKL